MCQSIPELAAYISLRKPGSAKSTKRVYVAYIHAMVREASQDTAISVSLKSLVIS